MEAHRRDLRRRTVSSASWTAAGQVLRTILLLGAQVVLLRLLSPREFGLVAMTLPFTAVGMIFASGGLAAGIIQRPRLGPSEVSTAFWLSLVGGCAAAAGLVVGAGPVAEFFGEPQVRGLLSVMAVSVPMAAINSVQRARLERDLRFRPLVLVDAAATAVAGAAAIGAATQGAGAWSLVVLAVAQQIGVSIGLVLVAPWRPGRWGTVAEMRGLLQMGGGLVGFEVVNLASRNTDDVLIGRVLGPVELGAYSRAYEVMLVPIRQVGQVLGRVMFASLSRMGDDKRRVRQAYLRAVTVVATFTFPAMIGMFVLADEVVRTVFGDQWEAAIDVIRVLAVAGLLQSVITTVGWIYLSQGQTALMFRWGVGSSMTLIVGIVAGISFGTVEAVAVCYTIATGPVLLYPAFAIPGRLIDMTFMDVARTLLPTFFAAAAMGGILALLAELNPLPSHELVGLGVLVALGAALYGGIAFVAKLDGYRDLRVVLDDRRRRGEGGHPGS